MAKGCEFLKEDVTMDGTDYDCDNPLAPSTDGSCDHCALGALKGKAVVIEVLGGVADVTTCPEDITVIIIDHDNLDDDDKIEVKHVSQITKTRCSNNEHNYEWNQFCGAEVCSDCGDHKNLTRCFCGWSFDGGDGRRQLEELGETIESEPE
jgi:hypothetical protein